MRRLALISLAILAVALALGACGSASPTTNSAAGAKAAAVQFVKDFHDGRIVQSETTSHGWAYLQSTQGSLPFRPSVPDRLPSVKNDWAYFAWGNTLRSPDSWHYLRFVYERGRWLFNDAL